MELTTNRFTRVGVHSFHAAETFTHVCVCLCGLTVLACLFLLHSTYRIVEPNLPARVQNVAVCCRLRGGFARVGGEFTEALSWSLPRKPFLRKGLERWVSLSYRPVFSNQLLRDRCIGKVVGGVTEIAGYFLILETKGGRFLLFLIVGTVENFGENPWPLHRRKQIL